VRLSCLPPSVYSICDRSQIFPSVTTLLIAGSICIVIQDSGASAVLSMAAQSFGIRQDVDVPLLNLDEMDLKSLLGTKPALQRQIIPQDRSYCLYTSGTTGTPKGCELTHENAVQALLAFQRIFAGHWNDDSRMLQFAFFHFDVSVLEQFWSWSVGIRVVSAPRDVIFEDLVNSINTLGITHIDLTPSLAQLVHPDDVPSLCKGVFITGGESLKQEILDVWGSKSVIYNGYGPTEATIGVTMYPRVPINGKSSNIGWQFDNVGTYVLQPGSDLPLLRGGIGELIISGKLVGKGYLNREALTSRSFPYLERFKERVYRTGDLVRVLHDGSFEFLGRADDQVKLRGQRLEIGEINTVIRRSSARVSDVATLVLKHPKQQKEQLVTFVVLQTKAHSDLKILWGESSTVTRAREACHDKLPPYMVPTHFITLGRLPLNINNKADTKRLKELYQGLSSIDLQKLVATSSERAQSLSQDEQQLRKVLGAEFETSEEDIGRDTSFFELGMDSISVIGVVRALKQAGFVTATASLVMSKSTFRRLSTALASTSANLRQRASLLAAQQAIHATQRYRWTVSRSISAAGSEIEALAPCTSLQQGMIARYLESNDGMYFNTFQFELSDQVDLSRLRAAWQTVYALAQALRTVFVNTEDGYVQAVLSNTKLPLTDTSIQDENESLYESLARLRQVWLQCNNADLKRPFEITHLITPSKNLLVVRIFHGLYDGISIELIFRAVWKVYNGAGFNKDAPSYHSALAYGPLRNVEGAKKFWQNHLMSNPSTSLPPSAGDSGNNPARVIREINLHATFESTRRTLNVTAKAIAQAVWVSVLSTHIQGSAAVGMVVSGRSIDLEGADRVLGPMFNTIPYRHRHQTGESWLSIIKRVHDFNVAAHPFQHTPLRDIMKWCQRDRSQALFDSLFVYQAAPDDDQWARNEMWELIDGNTTSDYPVAFEVEQRTNNRWKLTLVTQAHISDESTSNALLDQFETALHQAIVDPTFVPKTSWQAIGAIENSQSIEDQTRPDANDHTKFEWTDEASFVREQLARLAGTAIGEINESTSIFELGLDSIDAIKLSSKLKKRGVDLPVSGIMRGLTIAGMTSQISWTTRTEQALHSASTNAITHKRNLLRYVEQQNLDTNNVEDVLPLTPLQEAMVADMVASDFTRYYNIDVMKLDHGTEVERLRDAWTQVVSTSPILRTSFVEVDDPDLESSYVQLVHSQAHNSFWALVTMEEEPDFPKVFQSLRYEARIASSGEPPFHILLIQAPEHIYLVLSIAHALYDGWSLALLHADVKRAFEGHHEPRPDYQPALMEIVTSSGADAASFWRSYLENSAPTQFPRRSVQVERIPVVHRLENSSTLRTTTVTDFVKKSSVSLQTLGQAVFAVVLASYTRSLDVTFGSILSGRDDATTSQLLFPTMNAVAIRAILHGSRLELLRYVQDSILEMKRWQHFPLRKALALTGVHERLLGSLFIYQKSSERDTKEEKQLYKSIDGHSDVEYPVCVEMEVVHGEIIWRCAVKEEIFDADGARELLGRLHQVMEEITRRPDKPVIDFTPRGISVCELPPFLYDEETELPGASLGNDASPDGIGPNPQTLQVIRQILAAVSGTSEDDITNDMSIFHTGLDSISAMKVCSLLRKKGIVLSVGEMLRAGSVENMARVADANSSHETEESEDYIAVRATTRDLDRAEILRQAGSEVSDAVEMLPVTAGQLYMLSMWINTKGSNFYVDFPYTVIGSISFSELKSAWKALVAANPILRSMFIATRDLRIPYAQVIPDAKERELAIVDVTEKTGEQISEILKQIETQQPFVGLLVSQRLEPAGWDLKLKIHHALYDGVSLPILIHQLQDLCNGVSNPSPSSTTFARYIASSHTPSALSSRKAFWTQYLASISQHDRLPQPDPSVTSRTEIFRPIFLPSRALESTARQNGLSVHSLFLAAYARQYASFISNGTPQPTEVIVGIYLANRSGPICGIEDAAVPTVNLLPLRITSPLSRDVINIACQVQSDLQRISESAHACASLFEIHEWTGVAVDTFVNFLTFPNAEKGKGEASGVAITPKNGWGESVSRTVEQVHEDQRGLGDLLGELRDERVGVAYLVRSYLLFSS
jgi:amino acid adenylation domain-containing protein